MNLCRLVKAIGLVTGLCAVSAGIVLALAFYTKPACITLLSVMFIGMIAAMYYDLNDC